jgi:hypothetical protein
MPFLTDLDSRAAVKGSRDPLGIQQIWTRMGRHVVGNLTTVSTSVRDYGTLLLGYHFAEVVAEDVGPGRDLVTFLKWEQLAAYSRAKINGDYAFRGTDKVRRLLDEGERLWISDDRRHQILSNQKIYGLWGLYTGPARTSGLLEGDPTRLTSSARAFVEEHYLPRLGGRNGRYANRIREILRQKRSPLAIEKGDAGLAGAIAAALPARLTAAERAFYRSYLLETVPGHDLTQGRQQQFVELLKPSLSDADWRFSPTAIGHFAKQAKGRHWESLADRLERIRVCETVMASASTLFAVLLGLDGEPMKTITGRMESAWGPRVRTVDHGAFGSLRVDISGEDPAVADRWIAFAEGLATGDYRSAVTTLVQQNCSVMAKRGGAAWIEFRGGRFHVRVRDEQGHLPDREELPELWRFPYFLESLRTVAETLAEDGDA